MAYNIEIDWRLLIGLVLVFLWIVLSLRRRWAQSRRNAIASKRSARAMRGEEDAEALLESAGFEILDRQLRRFWTIACDGEDMEIELRADLLVAKAGCEYIAEVKTGDRAPNLSVAATRRQLLEYSIAYNSEVILLVDVEQETIHYVQFGDSGL